MRYNKPGGDTALIPQEETAGTRLDRSLALQTGLFWRAKAVPDPHEKWSGPLEPLFHGIRNT